MSSNPLVGKFGPVILVVLAQLIVVLALPSTAGNANSALGTSNNVVNNTGNTGGVAGTGPIGSGGTLGAPGTPGVGGNTTSGSTGGTAGGAGPSGAAATGGVTSAGGTSGVLNASGSQLQSLSGDRTHCAGGRQFSPNLDYYAPPCVPGVPGAPFANNGGSTWSGVTGRSIEVVNYVADYGAEVDQILKAQGLYYNAQTASQWNKVFSDFMNSHFQFWGRKIHVDTIEGTCQTVPPDYACLIGEMDRIVATYHPYAVFWETTVCSACYAELSRLHVVNFGGGGFSDQFHNANAPYNYDAGESSSRIELQFADWWCHQMTSQGGSGRTAIFAGTQNATENFRHSPRVLGVVSTNDPDNEDTVKNVLYPALRKGCGENVTHQYFYAQNINTASTQSQQTEQAMNTSTNPATSVLCLCDPVAPQFGLNAYAEDNYWPESILASDQTMDFDSNGQTYSSAGHKNDSLACPTPQRGCGYDNTVGLAGDNLQTNPSQMASVKIWNMMTHGQPLPVAAATLEIVWADYSMFGSLVENTGPLLTPQRMQDAAPQLGARGGGTTGHLLRAFHPGDWSWTQDVAVVYWDAARPSPYNGVQGHYVQIEGSNFDLGQYPSLKEPPAPEPENRT